MMVRFELCGQGPDLVEIATRDDEFGVWLTQNATAYTATKMAGGSNDDDPCTRHLYGAPFLVATPGSASCR